MPGNSPTNTSIGLAKRSFRPGISRRRRKHSFHWRAIFPNHRCASAPWWRRRRRAQQTNEWPQVASLLEPTNSVFQRAVQMDPANELVARGSLLLAQAKFVQSDFAGAAAVLESLNSQTLKPELDWQRAYLLYQVKLAAGDTNAALAATTNLVQIARSENNDVLQAEGLALRAGVLEQLGQKSAALAAYQEILTLNAPAERQRQAILKMAELAIAQNQFSDAEQSLDQFLVQFPNSPATDVALLTLGELQLKDYIAQLAATNQLPEATNQLSDGASCAFRPVSPRVPEQSARRQGVSGPRLVFVAGKKNQRPRNL